ncbi:MAG: hypothetical protein J4N95_01650 [Chloroflexi bacterium]|nr:hypothetical protein [Chloroflexota bacterium]MCI0855759.1 hypothetical protein [Chloroflexota bacterium]MCI0889610.1 hypothetical protein [Chloroflexota bacterium]
MSLRRAIPIILVPAGLLLGLLAVGVISLTQSVSALPPAGSDTFNVTAEVGISSRLGEETIPLSGTFRVERGDPGIDEKTGVEVVMAEITSIDLQGESLTGPVSINQSPVLASLGEIRSLQEPPDQFPADSFFDIFIEARIPASPQGELVLHNEDLIRLVPVEGDSQVSIDSWPPVGVTYSAELDPCVALLPALPAEVCVESISITIGVVKTPTPSPTFCPPEFCTPTLEPTPTITPCPEEVCPATPTNTPISPTPTATPTEPPFPEDPTFSVAAAGPSGAHPADLLGFGEPVSTPQGNDNFADAFLIETFPFSGAQSTFGATIEEDEQVNPTGCVIFLPNSKGATVWFTFTTPSAGTMTASTAGSDYDTVFALYTGPDLASLAALGCDDDSGPGTLSEMSLPLLANTTYYLQVGGFGGRAGNLVLTVDFIGTGGVSGSGLPGFIPCENLGLTADGCDNGLDGDQDNLDALSFGEDFEENDWYLAFSVAPGSTGLGGSGVAQQAACSPAQPQADEFATNADATNVLFFDGDGIEGSCPTSHPMGLIELPTSDDLNALNEQPPSAIDTLGDGTLDDPVFFSLSEGSPSLAAFSRGPADVLWTVGLQPGLYVSAQTLGLQSGDDIDGMCISDIGTGPSYDPEFDTILFSLTADSPTLDDLGASGADVLRPGPSVHFSAGQLGLRVSDDLNAMKCFRKANPGLKTVAVGDIWFCGPLFQGEVCDTTIDPGTTVQWDFGPAGIGHTVTDCGESCSNPTISPHFDSGVVVDGSTFKYTFDSPGTYLYYCQIHPTLQLGRIIVLSQGDADCSGEVNAIDAALVLQLVAGLAGSLPCEANADANSDGSINSIDAALILQFTAGLVDQLPP